MDNYTVIPVLPTLKPTHDLECQDMVRFEQDFVSLVLGMQQLTGSGGVHTHPGARLLMAALCLLLDPAVAIETGPDAGVTTQCLAVATRHGTVIAIDNCSEISNLAVARYNLINQCFTNVGTVIGDALEFLRNTSDESVNFAFIDDDHSEEHVRLEMIELLRVMSRGGVAVFHDVTYFPYIEKNIREIFTGWDILVLPAISPTHRINGEGKVDNLGDMGIAIVRRPK
jgi:predicted O-methyltransferase YrrM